MWQVGLTTNGHPVSKPIAEEVSKILGGNGTAELVDSGEPSEAYPEGWAVWMIDMPNPFDGTVKIALTIEVETPMP